MFQQNDLITYLQQLTTYLEAQDRKVNELEMKLMKLQSSMERFETENANRPEKIEYRFDQLKVERLEGTLNIGITPNTNVDSDAIEDFSVEQNNVRINETSGISPIILEKVKKEINTYLNNDCYEVLQNIETRYNYRLDENYRQFIIDDIRKQIDQRIIFYIKELNKQNPSADNSMDQIVIQKVIADINRTLEEFVSHLPMKGE